MKQLAVITGGNRGLGRATAKKLAAAGYAVVLTSRDLRKGEDAAAEIRQEPLRVDGVTDVAVTAMALDLSSFSSVRAFASTFRARFDRLDLLVCNAGVMQQSPRRLLSVDGHEITFATNHLGHFLLTTLLLDLIQKDRGRVVVVTSRLHLPGSRGDAVHFDFDDVDLGHGYSADRAYKNSKLCNLWFAYELQRRVGDRGVVVNAVCPGFVPTTAAASTHGVMHFVMTHLMPHMPFAHSIDEATDNTIKVATDTSIGGGGFWGEGQPIESSAESHDLLKQRRLWELSEALTDVDSR